MHHGRLETFQNQDILMAFCWRWGTAEGESSMYGADLDKHPWGRISPGRLDGVHVMAALKDNWKDAIAR